MEYERKEVTITWEIENVEYRHEKFFTQLYSPEISVDEMVGTKWILEFYSTSASAIRLILTRETEDNGPKKFELDYEFSAKTPHGKYLQVKRNCACTFTKGQSSPNIDLSDDEPFESIIVQCQMWPRRRSISKNCHFFIHTPIIKELCEFVGVVENFSKLSEGVKTAFKSVYSSNGKELMKVNFRLGTIRSGCCVPFPRRTYLKIDFDSLNEDYPLFYFQVFFLDSFGNKLDLGKVRREFNFRGPRAYILPVTKDKLMEKKALYLRNDTLSLHCEVTIYGDIKHDISKTMESEIVSISEAMQKDSSSTIEALTQTKSIPCDVKIHTATEIILAHTEVLKSQSSIFEAMFRNNTEEADEKTVYIDDLDSETVKRMLVFLYSGTFKILDWKDAFKLYIAAEKYQIQSLKKNCSSFLEQNIDLSNCIVLLHLADMYKDNNLKKCMQNFIAENMPQVLHCEQWKDFEKDNPQIAIELCHESLRKYKLV